MIASERPPGDVAVARAAPETPGCASHARRWVLAATVLGSSLAFIARPARSLRSSSWDRSGRNRDFVYVGSGETAVLLDVEGTGCVTHLYCAMVLPALTDYRDAILRCFGDGETTPSVEVPLGDFFCLSHARVRELVSACVSVNPGLGASHGLNAYFPMPFARHARMTIEHRGEAPLGGLFPALWFHVDYELYDEPLPPDALRFHAQCAAIRAPSGSAPSPTPNYTTAPTSTARTTTSLSTPSAAATWSACICRSTT